MTDDKLAPKIENRFFGVASQISSGKKKTIPFPMSEVERLPEGCRMTEGYMGRFTGYFTGY